MSQVSTIGLDLAKNVFQFHGIDAELCGILGDGGGQAAR